MIIAVIPAHNEQEGIVGTIESLQAQTVPPSMIIVSADNCSDNTVPLARSAGAEVYRTKDNAYKKAGALNQVLDQLLPTLEDDDLLLILDADGALAPDWIEKAKGKITHRMGAISGVCRTTKHPGIISTFQAAEYAQDFRRVARNKGNANVLSGAAAMFTGRTIKALHDERGMVYDVNSLTEDFEITLRLKMMGYKPKCFKSLVVTTDVMRTWSDLWTQRLRWQRGTLETLRDIGYNKVTRKMWWTIVFCYLSTILMGLTVLLWGATLYFGLGMNLLWLAVMPVFMVEQWVTSRGAGIKASIVSAMLVPTWLYGMFRSCVYWSALFKVVKNSDKVWIT